MYVHGLQKVHSDNQLEHCLLDSTQGRRSHAESEDRLPSRSKVRFGENQIRDFSPEMHGSLRRTRSNSTHAKKVGRSRFSPGQAQSLWHQWSLQNQKRYARTNDFLSCKNRQEVRTSDDDEHGTPVQRFNSWIQAEFEDLDFENQGSHADAKAPNRSPISLVKLKSRTASGVSLSSSVAKLGSFSLKSVTLKGSGKPMDKSTKWKEWGEQRQREY